MHTSTQKNIHMQTHIKSPRHVHVRLSWVPLVWQWESWHHHAPFPPLFSDRAELFSLPEWAQRISFSLYSAECQTRACYGYSCMFEKTTGSQFWSMVQWNMAELRSIKLDLWNSYMELLPLNSTVILNTENQRFYENNNDWDFFPNCFTKLTKVNLATVCLRNKMNSHEKKCWRKYGFKFFGREKWKINTGALACFTLLHQSGYMERGGHNISSHSPWLNTTHRGGGGG